MNTGLKYCTCCLLFTFYCLLPAFAYAHKVNIFAYAEDGMIHSESYFVDRAKCKNSPIEVFDGKEGTRLLEGKTDENGNFSFKIPKVTSLRLVLHASMGHQNEYTLSEDEVREAMGDRQRPGGTEQGKEIVKSSSPPVRVGVKTGGKSDRGVTDTGRGMGESEMEALMERIIDRKLQPVTRMLVNLQEKSEKPGITEIVGGIGYIVGLMGVALYLKRKFTERK